MTDPGSWLSAARQSHDRLVGLISPLDSEDLQRQSYCSDWTVAQVMSHLGSQAEIFSLFVDAGLEGREPPTQAAFAPIWDSWNGRGPAAQSADSIAANDALLSRLEGLDDHQLASFRLDLFGRNLDIAGLLRMRLSEHALHTWDIAVAFDPSAQLSPDSVELLVDGLAETVARAGKAAPHSSPIVMSTTQPDRRFVLHLDDPVRLEAASDAAGEAAVELPAESWIRLVYGRLDRPDSADQPVPAERAGIVRLREAFPGF
jgi:uncharacterized protein (TIGR03083 family)